MSERESTCNRRKVHIGREAYARQGKCMHAREKESAYTRVGKYTCGEGKHWKEGGRKGKSMKWDAQMTGERIRMKAHKTGQI